MAKTTKQNKPKTKRINGNAIIGVLQLFTVASICYSTAVIALGTEGLVPLILVAPQSAFAVVTLIKRFIK